MKKKKKAEYVISSFFILIACGNNILSIIGLNEIHH